MDAVDPDALPAAALHRQHSRLDDRRTRTPTLAGVRIDAHDRGLLEARTCRQWAVYAAWLHGSVRRAGDSLSVPDASRNRARSRTGTRQPFKEGCRLGGTHAVCLVLACCTHDYRIRGPGRL